MVGHLTFLSPFLEDWANVALAPVVRRELGFVVGKIWSSLLLLGVLVAAGDAMVTLEQGLVSVTVKKSLNVELICKSSGKLPSYIHWYRSQPGKPPQRLLYFSTTNNKVNWDEGFKAGKFQSIKAHDDKNTCKLLVFQVEESDSAMYYCASWDLPQCPRT